MFSGKTLLVRFVVLFTALQLFSCTDAQRPPTEPPSTAAKPAVAPSLRSPVTADSCVFDIAALVGLTAGQIPARLGKPVSDQQESIDEEVKSLNYQRQGYDLSIEYNVQSRRVVRFYLNPHKSTIDNYLLLHAANIDSTDSRLTIQYLNEEDGRYRGLLVMPDSAVSAAQR